MGDMYSFLLYVCTAYEFSIFYEHVLIYQYLFYRCGQVYPLQIIRHGLREKITPEEVLDRVIKDCNELGVTVVTVVADAPKRAFLKGSKRFNADYGKSCSAVLYLITCTYNTVYIYIL